MRVSSTPQEDFPKDMFKGSRPNGSTNDETEMEGEGWWWACCVCDEGGVTDGVRERETRLVEGSVSGVTLCGGVKRALVHTLSVVLAVCVCVREVLEVRVVRDRRRAV